jgi:ketosteroid isomerase-like protein
MKRFIFATAIALLLMFSANAQTAPDAAELTKLLNDFLAGASHNDAAMHDRFWADELVYTGSGGRRRTKTDVMHDVRSAPAPKPGAATTTYNSEDVRIQQYGNTAVIAFRLVATSSNNGVAQVANFLNTGTFLKRNGKWQVIAWQATKMALSEAEAIKQVSTADTNFHRALLAGDAKALEDLTSKSFIWTRREAEQVTREQLLAEITAGQLKFTTLETRDVQVVVVGETAVVRGVSSRQRTAVEGVTNPGDIVPVTVYYTMTFVNDGGAWRAIALHTSRP